MTDHWRLLDRATRIMNAHGLTRMAPRERGAILDLLMTAIESNLESSDAAIAEVVRGWTR
jgi:hypothetical protein